MMPSGLVQVEHLGAHGTLGDRDHLVDQVAHHRVGERAHAADRRAVHERVDLGQGDRPPAARAAVMLAAPNGSAPTMRTRGWWRRSHRAMPASRPPPPTGTTTVSSGPGACEASSTATVPWPAMVRGIVEGVHVHRPVRSLSAWAAALASS